MKIGVNWTILSISVLFTAQRISGLDQPKPGDACSLDSDCDPIKTFLECPLSTKTCRCQDPGTSYYDEGDGKCHKFVDEPCLPSEMSCPLNGGCSLATTPPTCTCLQAYGFHVTGTKKCAKSHGQPCTESTQCDRDSFAICGEEADLSCACDETTSIFDAETMTCVLKNGAECQTPLSPFSSVEIQQEENENDDHFDGGRDGGGGGANDEREPPIQPCGKWTECKENYDGGGPASMTCQCVSGLVDNGEGECRIELGGPCGDAAVADSPPCNEANFLECDEIEERCECKSGLVDNENGQCRVAELDGDCGPDLFCNELSFMVCSSEYSGGKCQCKAGLTANGNEECRANEGQPCDPMDLPCDESSGLVCSNEKDKVCVCQSGRKENGKCVAGFFCQEKGNFGEPNDCSLYHSCQVNEAGDFWDTMVTCPETTVWCQAARECRESDVCSCP